MAAKRKQPRCGSRWRFVTVYDAGKAESSSDGTSVLDEVVLDDWLHLEQLDARKWFLSVGERRMWITVRRDGSVSIVDEEWRAGR
jgi:hypothetical protein